MRTYQKFIKITFIATIVSLTLSLVLHYGFPCDESAFWVSMFVSILSGAILTLLTSIIGYLEERRKTLEKFCLSTLDIIDEIDKYNVSLPLEEKLRFWVNYLDISKNTWTIDSGDICFFFDTLKITHNGDYIYNNIYKPICDFNSIVINHNYHFSSHLNKTACNEAVMIDFIDEIEKHLFRDKKLVRDILDELYGHYYDIMYSHKKKQSTKDS